MADTELCIGSVFMVFLEKNVFGHIRNSISGVIVRGQLRVLSSEQRGYKLSIGLKMVSTSIEINNVPTP